MNGTVLKALIETMRPKQWIKNLLVFAGVLFSLKFFDLAYLLRSIAAFFIFSAISGSVYIMNDLMDYKRDLAHPEKCSRPIPSGRLSRSNAVIALVILAIVSFSIAFRLSISFGLVASGYFVMNIAYSWKLKHVVIIDVMIIALGFVLRAVAGSVVIHVDFSHWLLMCTMLLALFLAICKRRHELYLIKEQAGNHRAVLDHYTPALIDQMTSVVTASALVTYALYTISPEVTGKLGTNKLIYTFPFVLFAIFRYLYLVISRNQGGSPEKVFLQDKAMIVDMALWILTVFIILYFRL
ncbi:decaprenyl-phosphate phosphoribosyltransferase [bacterium]|nr:decaprenyl-phosphate phosphoribosyltransferase [candidate division CSSED10-310 bacterium]